MTYLAHIADRVFGRPLLMHPDKLMVILSVLEGRIGLDGAAIPRPEANRLEGLWDGEKDGEGRLRNLRYKKHGSTAVVTVDGSLVNRGAWIGTSSGLQSYEGIEAQVLAAARADDIETIMLDIDSPGGEATGMYRLAEAVRRVRGEKPVVAYVDDLAASAAYGIASAADRIFISPTSITGSIGVVMVHADRSGEMEQKGIKPTLIHAGAHKVDGHPFGPLPKDVAENLQREVNAFYDRFVETVVAGRSSLTDKAVRNTEARVYIGRDAIDLGLADDVASFEDVITEYSTARRNGRTLSQNRRPSMSETTSAPAAENAGIPKAEHDAAVSAAGAEGASAERERIKAILGSEEAQGRTALAQHFAFNTAMSPEDAKAALAAAPVEAKAGAAPEQTFEGRKQQAAAGAVIDMGGPAPVGEQPRSGLSKAVDRYVGAQR